MGVLKRLLSGTLCLTIFSCLVGVLSVNATKAYVSGDTSNTGTYTAISDRASKLIVKISDSKNSFGASNVYLANSRNGTVLQNSNLTITAVAGVHYNATTDRNNINKSDLVGASFINSSRVYLADNNSLYLAGKERDGRVAINDDTTSPRGSKLSDKSLANKLIYSSDSYVTLDKRSVNIGSAKTYYVCYEVLLAKHLQNPCRYYFTLDTVKTVKEQDKINTSSNITNKSYAEGFKDNKNVKCSVNNELNFVVKCQSNISTTIDYDISYRFRGKTSNTNENYDIMVASVKDASPSGDGYLKTYGITFANVGQYTVNISMSRAKNAGSGMRSQLTITVDVIEGENSGGIEQSLSFDEQKRVDDINSERKAEVNNGIWSGIYVIFAICGIIVLIYSLLIIITYYIDILNSFTSVSLLNKITFGSMYPVASKDESVDVDTKRTHVVSHKEIWLAFALGVMSATVMFNARGFILLIISAFNWVSELFRG